MRAEEKPPSLMAPATARARRSDRVLGASAFGFGKYRVKADHAGALAQQHFTRESGHAIARPGPLPQLGHAGFVHVHDDDALIQRAGHEQPQPRVIQALIGQLQQSSFMHAQHVQQGGREDGQDQRGAPEAMQMQAHGGLSNEG